MTTTWLLLLALTAAPPAPKAAAPAPAAEAPAKPAPTKPAKAADKKAGKKTAAAQPQPPPPAEAPPLPPPPSAPYRWNVPKLLSWVDSVGVQVSDGVPMVLEMARSGLPMEELVQHFADEFQAAGLFIPPDAFQESFLAEPRLTGLDSERMVAYTVVFQPNPDRTTTLYLGTADMSRYDASGAGSLEWAPVMPGAQKLMRTEMEVAQSAVYAVNATDAEVMAFYREQLGAQGFKEQEPGTFKRGGELLRVFTQEEGGQRSVGLTRRTGPADEPPAVAPAPVP
ncbi:hypothetical protein P2318_01900 [Myxococcaceae bacterium GXIMD 01537]